MTKHLCKMFVLLFFVAVHFNATAQKLVYYLKNNGKQVSTKDSADFIRMVSEPDSGSKLYNVKEYYTNGAPKFIGKSSWFKQLVFEGRCISFFPSGKRKSIIGYKGGYLDGDCYLYYPNGKLYAVRKYGTSFINGKAIFDDSIISCNDSTGNPLVVDGNGHFIDFDDDFKVIIAQGEVVGGKPDGYWIRKKLLIDSASRGDTITFKDHYIKGVFDGSTSGSIISANGVTFEPVEIQPEFVGGESALGKFLQRNLKYPDEAKKHHITGRVYIQFVVERDGSLTDINVTRSPSDVLSQEAIRVMTLSPRWHPGMHNGKPVRVRFTLPVNFSLGDN